MASIVVPRGKKLLINRNGSPVVNVDLILEEDITMSISSNFEPLFGGHDSKLLNTLGGISRDLLNLGFSGQFKQLGFQVWKNTDPITFNTTVGLYVDKTNVDALTQVYQPALQLMKIPVPSEGTAGNLIPPGPSALDSLLGNTGNSAYNTFSIEIGKILRIDQIIIRKAEPTFSLETDEDDYPMWCKIALDIQSVATCTTQMLVGVNTSPISSSIAQAQDQVRGIKVGKDSRRGY